MRHVLKLALPSLGVLVAGCNSLPFGQVAKYDPTPHAAIGSITLSDAKVYSRETLMNERAKEVARLQKLIDGIDQVEFKPDVVREVELITAFAASLGVRSDPAAGLTARRAKETADVQQEISTLQLKLQLEQLRRDAELMRSKLADQTEAVNKDLGKVTATAPAAAASGVTAPSVDFLVGKIDGALTALKAQLAVDGKPAALTTVASNPFDTFRDRQAYLDMLRSARNASALDELHDLGNAALMRINLQAAVIPDPNFSKSLGAVQVSVEASTFGDQAKHEFLNDWLDHVNRVEGTRTGSGDFSPSSDAKRLEQSGRLVSYKVGSYEYMLPFALLPGSPDRLKKFDDAQWTTALDYRKTWNVLTAHRADPGPRTPVFAALCDDKERGDATRFNALQSSDKATVMDLKQDVYLAEMRVQTFNHVSWLNRWQSARGLSVYASSAEISNQAALDYLAMMKGGLSGIPACETYVKRLEAMKAPTAKAVWGALADQLDKSANVDKARIYEVGPREHVQQMSTVARSANSLMLAASVAATVPTSGVAADAALGYSRQAVGRATTLERIPSVVGYSIGGEQTFGWVFGPRAWLDPKGRIDVEQLLKPYDLSVDLSVPAWWPSLKLKVTTLWGPSPQELAYGTLGKDKRGVRDLQIPMVRRAPDYDWFTHTLIGAPSRAPKIDGPVAGGPINACFATTLIIKGRNLWRTEKVVVLSQLLEGSAIAIAPDMDGIILRVPAIPPLAGNSPAPQDPFLHVITPFGRDTVGVGHITTPSGDDCKPKKPDTPADPDAVVFETVSPQLYFSLPGDLRIDVKGKNLDKVTRVTLHNQPSTLVMPRNKSDLTILFSSANTNVIPPLEDIKLESFAMNAKNEEVRVDIRPVRVVKK